MNKAELVNAMATETGVSKKDVESNGLKVGDFVKIRVAPAKTSGCFKIVL